MCNMLKNKYITYTNTFFDLKSAYMLLPQPDNKIKKGAANEQRQNSFRSNNGTPFSVSISEMRRQIQWGWTCKKFQLSQPVLLHGVCSIDIQREPEGHRLLPQRNERKTLPYGDKRLCEEKHARGCQREQRLENICGVRPSPHCESKKALCARRLRT